MNWLKRISICIALSYVSVAHAQNPDSNFNSVMAETLFRDGKKLFSEKNYEAACPKFSESYELDPAGGTLVMLAMCLEGWGKTASAWAKYNEALSVAIQEQRKDREQFIREQIEKLNSRLPHIRLNVPKDLKDRVVHVDSQILPDSAVDAPIPLDPGLHTLKITSTTCEPWSGEVRITESDTVTIAIACIPLKSVAAPLLPRVTAAPPAPKSLPAYWNTHTTAGWISMGAGAAAITVGSVFGVSAIIDANHADELCSSSTTCSTQEGLDTNERSARSADIATITVGAGLVVAAIGTVLLLTNPSRTRSAANQANISFNW